VLLVSACDGGPVFAAAVEYVNLCPDEVRVSVSNNYADEISTPRPSQAKEVLAGGRAVVINEILKPVPETVYLFVATESDQQFNDPFAIDLATLDMTVADDGTDVYTIVVSGVMCPES
jgi:hypothetical protein